MVKILRVLVLLSAVAVMTGGCTSTFGLRKTHWSVAEVKEWYAVYRTDPLAWDGILYQGSDEHWHHFCARIIWMDDWATIQIRKDELAMADERPYMTISSGKLGHYLVDPERDFMKLREFQ